MKYWFGVLVVSLAVGCTTARVRPYVGEQQAWPTSIGSIVNAKYSLPVFTTLPPARYAVLGELRIESPLYAEPEERHLPIIVARAKKELHADAIVLVDGQVFLSTTYGQAAASGSGGTITQVNKFNPDFFRSGVTALAIKWTAQPPEGLPEKYLTKKDGEMPLPEPAPVATTPEPEPEMTPPAAPAAPKAEKPAAPAPRADAKPKVEQPKVEAPTVESPAAPAPAAP